MFLPVMGTRSFTLSFLTSNIVTSGELSVGSVELRDNDMYVDDALARYKQKYIQFFLPDQSLYKVGSLSHEHR